jgi:hypothetical protein
MTRRVRNSSPRVVSTILFEWIADDPVKVAILDEQAAGLGAGCLLNQSISVILCWQAPVPPVIGADGPTAAPLPPAAMPRQRCRPRPS